CKSKQPINGDVEAEIHATYDKDFLYFHFRFTNHNSSDLSSGELENLGIDCKTTLESKFKLNMIVLGELRSESSTTGKKLTF
ncbi:MAG: hypothetical protein KGI11_04555, partial [Thaumarchaeota archaeon]|nr:hypothetical protein [Nitrososphaerota archaeon]